MILRRNNLRSHTPKKSKIFPKNKKPCRKKTPVKLIQHAKPRKDTETIDVLQSSLNKNMLSKVKKQINVIKCQLPKISLSVDKYKLRDSSCGIDDLLFLTSTPNKSKIKNKESKTSLAKTKKPVLVSQKKNDGIFIQKASQVQGRKKGLSISPIPVVQKKQGPRKRKSSESLPPKHLTKQIIPLSKKRKKQLSSQKDLLKEPSSQIINKSSLPPNSSSTEVSPRKSRSSSLSKGTIPNKNTSFSQKDLPKDSQVKTRNRSSLLPESSLTENTSSIKSRSSPQKDSQESPVKTRARSSLLSKGSLTEDTSSNQSGLSPERDSQESPAKTRNRSCLLSKGSLPEDNILNETNITTSKNSLKSSFQEDKRKECHSVLPKMKGDVKKTQDRKKINDKTETSKGCFVMLKRVSPRLMLQRDDLNLSLNTKRKNDKLRNSKKEFNFHQLEKPSKRRSPKNGSFKKSCNANSTVLTPATSTRSSAILSPTSSKKSICNSSIPKGNHSTKTVKKKNVGIGPNQSKTHQKKRMNSVSSVKKKNSIKNTKNSKSLDKVVNPSSKLTSKNIRLPMIDKHFNNTNRCLVDDIASAPFMTPTSYFKSKNKKTKFALISSPLNKKNSSKTKKSDGVSQRVSKKGLPAKGTLKRKRFMINALKEKSEGYEDDIFESSQFDKFKETLFMDDDSDISELSIATPKCAFLVTPKMPEKTPRFKDCFSPMELMKARKVAEEYIHRRNKRKLQNSTASESSPQKNNSNEQNENNRNEDPERKKLDFLSLAKNLNEKKNKSEDSDEDAYFSDASP